MNLLKKLVISIAAGSERIFYILMPILVASLWFLYIEKENVFTRYLIIIIGGIGSLFRAVKVGWMDG